MKQDVRLYMIIPSIGVTLAKFMVYTSTNYRGMWMQVFFSTAPLHKGKWVLK
jgi:hypothetical protein